MFWLVPHILSKSMYSRKDPQNLPVQIYKFAENSHGFYTWKIDGKVRRSVFGGGQKVYFRRIAGRFREGIRHLFKYPAFLRRYHMWALLFSTMQAQLPRTHFCSLGPRHYIRSHSFSPIMVHELLRKSAEAVSWLARWVFVGCFCDACTTRHLLIILQVLEVSLTQGKNDS